MQSLKKQALKFSIVQNSMIFAIFKNIEKHSEILKI